MTDPNLPARLRWAASRVDNMLSQDVWRPLVLGAFGDSTFAGPLVPEMWVGQAKRAHLDDLRDAKDSANRARQLLNALADSLRQEAHEADQRLERERIDAAINPFPGLGPNPSWY